ncbi:MAG: nucleotide pyrophosphohydrolase [Acidobacteriota bacterium]|nr:nucleotide pyrophosphohydrolase [Acidobacteriota bacterium]
MSELTELRGLLRDFAREREWLNYHDAKNLAMAVASEAGELLAEFRWLSPDEASLANLTDAQLRDIRFEMADVLIFLVRLADVLDVDLFASVREKLTLNADRFPVVESEPPGS